MDEPDYVNEVTVLYRAVADPVAEPDPDRWIEIQVETEAEWSMSWLNACADQSAWPSDERTIGPAHLLETTRRHFSWGADSTVIYVGVFVAQVLFGHVLTQGADQMAVALRERLGEAPEEQQAGEAISRARQRIAVRYGTDGAALRLGELIEGTDEIRMLLHEPDGSTEYEVVTKTFSRSVQSVHCIRRFT
ncbi:MAG: hypothetical protein HGA44_01620 [Cellulomonadaceae bacterium]|nr:hypothetical protein [Cellulomonadaceae bacterium]